jgi:hypothetical protein
MKKAKHGLEVLAEFNRLITPLAPNDKANNIMQFSWKDPAIPAPLDHPSSQALQDTAEVDVVGGIIVGKAAPLSVVAAPAKKRKRKCGVCRMEGCKGSGGREHCPLSQTSTSKKKRLESSSSKKRGTRIHGPRQCQLCVQYSQGDREAAAVSY